MPIRSFLLIAKLILYYLAYQLGFSTIAMGFTHLIAPLDMVTMTSLSMVASTLVMTWHLIHFGYVSLSHDKYKEVSLPILGMSAVFIFASMYVLNLFIEQIGIPNTLEDTFIAMSRNPFGVLSIALLAPILEELLFRGAIQGHLQETGMRPWRAILIASFIFGVVHMNPAQIPFAFLLGIIFGWLYYRTGSLLPVIVGHVLNNSIAAINMIFYGDATLEEQMPGPIIMWFCVIIAAGVCYLAIAWFNKRFTDEEDKKDSK